jgi:hypothetical protein
MSYAATAASVRLPAHRREAPTQEGSAVSAQRATKPFGRALRDLLLEQPEFVTGSGNVNWSAFAEKLKTVHYETLRKAISDTRPVTAHVIEDVAQAAGVEPDYFAEYRLAQAVRDFDVSEVGWEAAMENLALWADAHVAPAPKKKRR